MMMILMIMIYRLKPVISLQYSVSSSVHRVQWRH